jgi:hypothetical protein
MKTANNMMMSENTQKIHIRNKNQINEIDLWEMKRWLQRGDISLLAKEHKISTTTAYHVLAGINRNFAFLIAAFEKANENAQKVRMLNDQLRESTRDIRP